MTYDELYDDVVPVEEYWSDAHSMALHRFGMDGDVYDELVDEEYDGLWQSYSEGYDDDFETLYEDDQA